MRFKSKKNTCIEEHVMLMALGEISLKKISKNVHHNHQFDDVC
jgi:hypothetical protein